MNKITEVTRRNIFDNIYLENIKWSGRLEETDFLARMFDLSKLPSTDHRFKDAFGDIWQHRVNNFDWNENWIFTDSRFNLLHCDDSIFLQFLCEMIHPIIRSDVTEIIKLLQLFNDHIFHDGFEIIEKTKISGRSIFTARQSIKIGNSLSKRNAEIVDALSHDYVVKKINRMESAIETDTGLAIGTAKELIETMCKTICKNMNKDFDDGWDAPRLFNEIANLLKLTPKGISTETKASKTIKSILGSLFTVVHGVCELRNDYGTGHGKDSKFQGLSSRHAKLAVGASTTLAVFLLETLEERKNNEM